MGGGRRAPFATPGLFAVMRRSVPDPFWSLSCASRLVRGEPPARIELAHAVYCPMVSRKLLPMATQTASCVAAIPHGVFVLPPTGIVRTSLLVTGSISETEAPASQTEPARTARKLAGSRFETEVRLRCDASPDRL